MYISPIAMLWGLAKHRRTGAVGSPLELVGGWCPGYVLMAFGSCDVGVPVMF